MEFHANEDVIELAKSINKAMDVRTKPLHKAIEDFMAELETAWKNLNGIKYKNKELQAKLDKPITEHPDVQRLVGQVAEYQIKNQELADKNVELQAENKRLKEALRIAKDALSADADLYLPAYHNSKDIATIKKEAEVALVNIDKAERTNQ